MLVLASRCFTAVLLVLVVTGIHVPAFTHSSGRTSFICKRTRIWQIIEAVMMVRPLGESLALSVHIPWHHFFVLAATQAHLKVATRDPASKS